MPVCQVCDLEGVETQGTLCKCGVVICKEHRKSKCYKCRKPICYLCSRIYDPPGNERSLYICKQCEAEEGS